MTLGMELGYAHLPYQQGWGSRNSWLAKQLQLFFLSCLTSWDYRSTQKPLLTTDDPGISELTFQSCVKPLALLTERGSRPPWLQNDLGEKNVSPRAFYTPAY